MYIFIKAVLSGKLKRAQRRDSVKAEVPSIMICIKKSEIFQSPMSKRLAPGATGLCWSTALYWT